MPQSATYAVLYNFGASATDGEGPQGALIDLNGTLYGTTIGGGSGCYPSGGCGTVYAIAASGDETVLHNFGGAKDGAFPYAGITDVHGLLYGTTGGGASTSGTVFSMETTGKETVLYHFRNAPDGGDPHARVLNVRGALYGTTVFGGVKGRGTVYKITPSGKETVLYSFLGRKNEVGDGKYPNAGLLDVGGRLYGTTYKGGTHDNGTVFEITLAGKEIVLHSFAGGPEDGGFPRGGLIDVNGTLYGTTNGGGTKCSDCFDKNRDGVVFSITTSGKEKVLYRFKGYPQDGANPWGNLLDVDGTLYGTTEAGGSDCSASAGCGTIYSITPSGAETVLHSFLAKRDGAVPLGGLLNAGGTFYGTASQGGQHNAGTLFSMSVFPHS